VIRIGLLRALCAQAQGSSIPALRNLRLRSYAPAAGHREGLKAGSAGARQQAIASSLDHGVVRPVADLAPRFAGVARLQGIAPASHWMMHC